MIDAGLTLVLLVIIFNVINTIAIKYLFGMTGKLEGYVEVDRLTIKAMKERIESLEIKIAAVDLDLDEQFKSLDNMNR